MNDKELEEELKRLDRESVVLQRIIFEKEQMIHELNKKKTAMIELRHYRKLNINTGQ